MFKNLNDLRSARTVFSRYVVSAITTIAVGSLLVSCSTGDPASNTTTRGSINIQLSYLKNTEFAGEFLAIDNGHFADAGFANVTLTAGGSAATAAEPQVATGSAFLGITSPMIVGPAIAKGAPVKIVGATYQQNPFTVISSTNDAITDAQSLKGKTIAVADFNTLVWSALLKANNLTTDDVKSVPFTDGPAQLLSGQVDGYLTYTTAFRDLIPNSDTPATEMLLASAGLPMVAEVIIASTDTIKENRELLVSALTAIVKGWRDALADPTAAVSLTVDKYAADQNLTHERELQSMTIQNNLIQTTDTAVNGLLTVTPASQEETVSALRLAGIDIDIDSLFDLSPLDEVYANNPELTQ